jgi:hypothetical protein
VENKKIYYDFEQVYKLVQEEKNCVYFVLVQKCTADEFDKAYAYFLKNMTIRGFDQILRLADFELSVNFELFAEYFKDEKQIGDFINILNNNRHKIKKDTINSHMLEKLIENNYYKNQMASIFGLEQKYGMDDGTGSSPPKKIYYRVIDSNQSQFSHGAVTIYADDIKEYKRYLVDIGKIDYYEQPIIELDEESIMLNELLTGDLCSYGVDACKFFANPPSTVRIVQKQGKNNKRTYRGFSVTGGSVTITGVDGSTSIIGGQSVYM